MTEGSNMLLGTSNAKSAPLHRRQIAVLDGEEQLHETFALAFNSASTWIVAFVVSAQETVVIVQREYLR